MQIEGADVLIPGRLSHIHELDDVRVADVQEGCIGAPTGPSLTIGKAGGVIDPQMRHDAHRLIVYAPDTDVDTDTASEHREPIDFGEGIDEAF
jgi:hypothetical protein